MIKRKYILFLLIPLSGCITEYYPDIKEEKELLVVEGLITDQNLASTIKLSLSLPLGERIDATPLSGCSVSISDNLGNNYSLWEKKKGIYQTDSTVFRGIPGRFYTLHIAVPNGYFAINYESYPVEMKPVPPIDSIYYEKTLIQEAVGKQDRKEGCQIFLDTHDPENKTQFYRFDYRETWKLRLRADVPNQTCWINNISPDIVVESTADYTEYRFKRYPVTYISNLTDRLVTRYSIIVSQYSLTEDEFNYWKKLKNITVSVGGLHDIIPASIPSNIVCINKPGEKVLGYFSVSAMSSQRIYIDEDFKGIVDPYINCAIDTIYDGPEYIEGLGSYLWLLFDIKPTPFSGKPRLRILTDKKGCADCTVRGTTVKPLWWKDED
jgi:hypothetical protein